MPPSIISWNLTRLCNERCRHCYLDAGPTADRSDELRTAECLDVLHQLHDLSPGALLIFTGGEPLLRPDLYDLARAARDLGFTPVVGTNGIRLTPERIACLMEAGVQGVALSLDSLRPEVHDAFRGRAGAWRATVASLPHLREAGLPFVLQTTISRANLPEVPRLIAFAAEQGAQVHNLYFLVPSGRGASFTSDLTPQQYEDLLADIARWQQDCPSLLLGVKCAPHYQRLLYQRDADSPYLRPFDESAGGCPAGIQYLGIRPNGDVTPCPYLPVYGGNLRQTPLREIWEDSPVFRQIRARAALGGRCGACAFSQICSGCRARAWTAGNLLGEDPLCAYRPPDGGAAQTSAPQAEAVYGGGDGKTGLEWTDEARRRLESLPAFIRPMVARGTERYARAQGLARITPEVMHRARQALAGKKGLRMPEFVRRKLEAEGKKVHQG